LRANSKIYDLTFILVQKSIGQDEKSIGALASNCEKGGLEILGLVHLLEAKHQPGGAHAEAWRTRSTAFSSPTVLASDGNSETRRNRREVERWGSLAQWGWITDATAL
jgi:hypothetical protein